MKRYLPLLPVIIFPYLVVFTLLCMFNENFMKTFCSNDGSYLLLALLILYVIALVFSIVVFITGLIKKREAQDLLRVNMVIKLIHIPAYILIFCVGSICLLTIFTFGISIALMILDGMTILLSGLIGLAGVIRAFHEEKLSKKTAIIHGIFQFVFCADVINSIIVYRKVKLLGEIINNPLQNRL